MSGARITVTSSDQSGPSRDLPAVSIVVAALNVEAELSGCLQSILATDYSTSRREVIVVDNGSIDSTASVAHSFPVRHLYEDRRGVGYARNRGIGESGGEIVVFTDPDCLVSKQWLAELTEAFDAETVGAVGGAIRPYPGSTSAERFAAKRRSHAQERALLHPHGRFVMAANLAVRREALARVGMFDARFPGGGWGDADLCWRLSEAGLEIRYAGKAAVFHRYRRTPHELFAQHFRYGYGLALLRQKHRDAIEWGWPERARAYRALGAGACRLTVAAARRCLRRADTEELAFKLLELLRQLAQRSGFVAASLPGARFAPFRAPASTRGGR